MRMRMILCHCRMQKCLSVAIKDIGTKLETREHGSGDYRTEEMAKMTTENMSIESQKSVSALYQSDRLPVAWWKRPQLHLKVD